MHVTLKQHARSCAPGLTPRAVLEKFATMQMVDVHLPTTDGRQLVLPRYTQRTRDCELTWLAHPVPARQTDLAIQLHGMNPPTLPVTGKGSQTGRVLLRQKWTPRIGQCGK